jgi:hypothetical protein
MRGVHRGEGEHRETDGCERVFHFHLLSFECRDAPTRDGDEHTAHPGRRLYGQLNFLLK